MQMKHRHQQRPFVFCNNSLLACADDEGPSHFAPILINVTIKAVPSEPDITRPKFIIAVPCEMFYFLRR